MECSVTQPPLTDSLGQLSYLCPIETGFLHSGEIFGTTKRALRKPSLRMSHSQFISYADNFSEPSVTTKLQVKHARACTPYIYTLKQGEEPYDESLCETGLPDLKV